MRFIIKAPQFISIFAVILTAFLSLPTSQAQSPQDQSPKDIDMTEWDRGLLANMLYQDLFLKEIEAVPEQRKKIKSVIAQSRRSNTDILLKRSSMSKIEFNEKTTEVQTNAFNELMAILLPHQKKRLHQVMNQRKLVQVEGRYAKLVSEKFNKSIALTQAQSVVIKNITKENDKKLIAICKQFEKDVEAVLTSEKNQVLEKLTETQSTLLKEKLGDIFNGILIEHPIAGVLRKYINLTKN